MSTSEAEIDCSQSEAVARIYQKMGRAAVAKAYAVVGRMDIAKEIAQDVFLRLWHSKGRFPNEKAVYAWVYKSCHRAGIDYLRSAKFRRERVTDDGEADREDPNVSFGELVLSRDVIRRYMANLPQREAEIFLYITLDDMSHAEVAELLDVSTKTIQRTLQKAQLHFRNMSHELHTVV